MSPETRRQANLAGLLLMVVLLGVIVLALVLSVILAALQCV
jgi:hypothetical protein